MGKLQEQMKADLTLKGYSEHTHKGYLRRFAKHFMRAGRDGRGGNLRLPASSG